MQSGVQRSALKNKSFAVINADDFYGAVTFKALAESISRFTHSANKSKKIQGARLLVIA